MADNTDLSQVPLAEPEDGVFEAYSNIVNFDWTLTDVRLRFAQLIQVIGDDSPLWNAQKKMSMERAVITIPWHQAKSLRDYLTTLVDAYEAVNGEMKQLKLADPKRDA